MKFDPPLPGVSVSYPPAPPWLLRNVFRKIKATKAHAGIPVPRPVHPPLAGRDVVGIETVLIVDLALLGIAQDIVGFLNLLEAILGRFVAGIQIRMILARQLAVGLADLVFLGSAETPSVS